MKSLIVQRLFTCFLENNKMEEGAIQNPEMAFFGKHTGTPKKQLQLLPEDVIEEILSRLAVKSLLRFRSVCKRWNTLISSSRRFASMHLKRSLSNPTMHSIISFCGHSDDGRLSLVDLNPLNLAPLVSSHLDPYHPVVTPIDPKKPPCEFIGSINGLVCLGSIHWDESNWLRIWNPSTKIVRELNIPGATTIPDYYAVAFGWDPVANEHKVMRLCRSRGGSGGWVDVWSVGSCCWRSFEIEELGDVLPKCTRNIIMGDGRTFCLVSHGQQNIFGEHKASSRDLIACFDVVKEEIRFISLPVDCEYNRVSIVNWKGDLALSILIENPGLYIPPSFQIWKADIDGDECWTKSFIIDLRDVPCSFSVATSISPTQMLFFGSGPLILYDMETKEYQKVKMPDKKCFRACHHVQSLF